MKPQWCFKAAPINIFILAMDQMTMCYVIEVAKSNNPHRIIHGLSSFSPSLLSILVSQPIVLVFISVLFPLAAHCSY